MCRCLCERCTEIPASSTRCPCADRNATGCNPSVLSRPLSQTAAGMKHGPASPQQPLPGLRPSGPASSADESCHVTSLNPAEGTHSKGVKSQQKTLSWFIFSSDTVGGGERGEKPCPKCHTNPHRFLLYVLHRMT